MLPQFDVYQPRTLDEACAFLQNHTAEGVAVLGGGTDVLVNLRLPVIPDSLTQRYGGSTRPAPPKTPTWLVALSRIPELQGITVNDQGEISIGAMTSLTELCRSPLIQEKLRALAEGCDNLGTPLVRNRGTLGGNICNARPAADTLIPAVALSGRVELRSAKGTRIVGVEEFVLGPGKTVIQPDEILTRILFPMPGEHSNSSCIKLANRKALEIAVVNAASYLQLDQSGKIVQVRIALGAVGPTPILAQKAGKFLIGKEPNEANFAQAGEIAAKECRPIDDHRGSAGYRKEMVEVLVRRTLGRIMNYEL